jgi:glutamyl-tRNA synthetase
MTTPVSANSPSDGNNRYESDPSGSSSRNVYRGRIAPSPTGLLHLGHARTFWIAAQRASERGGQLIFRNENLDPQRCRGEFVAAMFEDSRWLGIKWSEGPDCGGAYGPYTQSERRDSYLAAWKRLGDGGMIYPCTCSRKDVVQAVGAPNDGEDEAVYPGTCREKSPLLATSARSGAPWECIDESARLRVLPTTEAAIETSADQPFGVNWRFRVPDGEEIRFTDLHLGRQRMVAGRDFGDFIVWRRDDVPAYQLAVVVDDAAMRITEVVRGADLLRSTARQILLFRALALVMPDFYHCDLVRDESGLRLAKRHDSLSIRRLRELGWTAEQVRAGDVGSMNPA